MTTLSTSRDDRPAEVFVRMEFCNGDAVSFDIAVGDQVRFGPSQCMQDVIISPLLFLGIGVFCARRVLNIRRLTKTKVAASHLIMPFLSNIMIIWKQSVKDLSRNEFIQHSLVFLLLLDLVLQIYLQSMFVGQVFFLLR